MRSKDRSEPQERQYSSLRNIYPVEEKRPVSALRGLLDAIPVQSEARPTASALMGVIDGNN